MLEAPGSSETAYVDHLTAGVVPGSQTRASATSTTWSRTASEWTGPALAGSRPFVDDRHVPSDERDTDDSEPFASIRDATSHGDAKQPPLRWILLGLDVTAVVLGWGVVMGIAVLAGAPIEFGPLAAVAHLVVVAGAGACLASVFGLYRRRVSAIRSVEIARIGRVSGALAILTTALLASFGREAALLAGAVGGITWLLLLNIERGVIREWITARRAAGDFGASVIVIGGNLEATDELATFLDENPLLGYRVEAAMYPRSTGSGAGSLPHFGSLVELVRQVVESEASGVVMDSTSLRRSDLNELVQMMADRGLHVHISSGLRGVDVRRITVSPLADEAFLDVAPLRLTRRKLLLKRGVDIVGAALALVLLSPLLAVVSLLVWAEDRGPILFRQERVGKDGELFHLFKLRSMVQDAEKLQAAFHAENSRSGPLFKLDRDPRVTRIGGFLRASSIDEVPQLLNVLQGSMSLVGPRPALPAEVALFDDRLNTRLRVKPGVTGLWQVEARDLPSFDLYRRYDLLYVQNCSIGVDLAVIARTVVVVALRAGTLLLPTRFRRAPAME